MVNKRQRNGFGDHVDHLSLNDVEVRLDEEFLEVGALGLTMKLKMRDLLITSVSSVSRSLKEA